MGENKITANLKSFLPLNRKERFYTGTVLPQIICYDNFKYFERFTSLIRGFPKDIHINPSPSANNIMFTTEYSLKESYRRRDGNKIFEDIPATKETPDLVTLIMNPEPLLILLEAKMSNDFQSGRSFRKRGSIFATRL